MAAKSKPSIPNRALSVRQPFAEQIICGTKKIEYRSKRTIIRERIYIYASKTLTTREKQAYKKMKKEPGDYEWHLANPKRLKKLIKPDNHPQPMWFKPFKQQKAEAIQ